MGYASCSSVNTCCNKNEVNQENKDTETNQEVQFAEGQDQANAIKYFKKNKQIINSQTHFTTNSMHLYNSGVMNPSMGQRKNSQNLIEQQELLQKEDFKPQLNPQRKIMNEKAAQIQNNPQIDNSIDYYESCQDSTENIDQNMQQNINFRKVHMSDLLSSEQFTVRRFEQQKSIDSTIHQKQTSSVFYTNRNPKQEPMEKIQQDPSTARIDSFQNNDEYYQVDLIKDRTINQSIDNIGDNSLVRYQNQSSRSIQASYYTKKRKSQDNISNFIAIIEDSNGEICEQNQTSLSISNNKTPKSKSKYGIMKKSTSSVNISNSKNSTCKKPPQYSAQKKGPILKHQHKDSMLAQFSNRNSNFQQFQKQTPVKYQNTGKSQSPNHLTTQTKKQQSLFKNTYHNQSMQILSPPTPNIQVRELNTIDHNKSVEPFPLTQTSSKKECESNRKMFKRKCKSTTNINSDKKHYKTKQVQSQEGRRGPISHKKSDATITTVTIDLEEIIKKKSEGKKKVVRKFKEEEKKSSSQQNKSKEQKITMFNNYTKKNSVKQQNVSERNSSIFLKYEENSVSTNRNMEQNTNKVIPQYLNNQNSRKYFKQLTKSPTLKQLSNLQTPMISYINNFDKADFKINQLSINKSPKNKSLENSTKTKQTPINQKQIQNQSILASYMIKNKSIKTPSLVSKSVIIENIQRNSIALKENMVNENSQTIQNYGEQSNSIIFEPLISQFDSHVSQSTQSDYQNQAIFSSKLKKEYFDKLRKYKDYQQNRKALNIQYQQLYQTTLMIKVWNSLITYNTNSKQKLRSIQTKKNQSLVFDIVKELKRYAEKKKGLRIKQKEEDDRIQMIILRQFFRKWYLKFNQIKALQFIGVKLDDQCLRIAMKMLVDHSKQIKGKQHEVQQVSQLQIEQNHSRASLTPLKLKGEFMPITISGQKSRRNRSNRKSTRGLTPVKQNFSAIQNQYIPLSEQKSRRNRSSRKSERGLTPIKQNSSVQSQSVTKLQIYQNFSQQQDQQKTYHSKSIFSKSYTQLKSTNQNQSKINHYIKNIKSIESQLDSIVNMNLSKSNNQSSKEEQKVENKEEQINQMNKYFNKIKQYTMKQKYKKSQYQQYNQFYQDQMKKRVFQFLRKQYLTSKQISDKSEQQKQNYNTILKNKIISQLKTYATLKRQKRNKEINFNLKMNKIIIKNKWRKWRKHFNYGIGLEYLQLKIQIIIAQRFIQQLKQYNQSQQRIELQNNKRIIKKYLNMLKQYSKNNQIKNQNYSKYDQFHINSLKRRTFDSLYAYIEYSKQKKQLYEDIQYDQTAKIQHKIIMGFRIYMQQQQNKRQNQAYYQEQVNNIIVKSKIKQWVKKFSQKQAIKYMCELKDKIKIKQVWCKLVDNSELNKSFRISVLDQFSFNRQQNEINADINQSFKDISSLKYSEEVSNAEFNLTTNSNLIRISELNKQVVSPLNLSPNCQRKLTIPKPEKILRSPISSTSFQNESNNQTFSPINYSGRSNRQQVYILSKQPSQTKDEQQSFIRKGVNLNTRYDDYQEDDISDKIQTINDKSEQQSSSVQLQVLSYENTITDMTSKGGQNIHQKQIYLDSENENSDSKQEVKNQTFNTQIDMSQLLKIDDSEDQDQLKSRNQQMNQIKEISSISDLQKRNLSIYDIKKSASNTRNTQELIQINQNNNIDSGISNNNNSNNKKQILLKSDKSTNRKINNRYKSYEILGDLPDTLTEQSIEQLQNTLVLQAQSISTFSNQHNQSAKNEELIENQLDLMNNNGIYQLDKQMTSFRDNFSNSLNKEGEDLQQNQILNDTISQMTSSYQQVSEETDIIVKPADDTTNSFYNNSENNVPQIKQNLCDFIQVQNSKMIFKSFTKIPTVRSDTQIEAAVNDEFSQIIGLNKKRAIISETKSNHTNMMKMNSNESNRFEGISSKISRFRLGTTSSNRTLMMQMKSDEINSKLDNISQNSSKYSNIVLQPTKCSNQQVNKRYQQINENLFRQSYSSDGEFSKYFDNDKFQSNKKLNQRESDTFQLTQDSPDNKLVDDDYISQGTQIEVINDIETSQSQENSKMTIVNVHYDQLNENNSYLNDSPQGSPNDENDDKSQGTEIEQYFDDQSNDDSQEQGTLIQKYNVKHLLGKGQFGEVYLVEDKNNKQIQYALKIITKANIPQKGIELVDREIQNQQKVKSQYSVKIIDFEQTQEKYYILMEYCNGCNLRQLRQLKGGQLNQEVVHNIIKQLSQGLNEIINHQVMHRDVKPENILLHFPNLNFSQMTIDQQDDILENIDLNQNQFQIKFADFGFSKEITDKNDQFLGKYGTPIYQAPQMIQNKEYTYKADIWSIGIILFEMINQIPPFTGRSVIEFEFQIRQGDYQFEKQCLSSLTAEQLLFLTQCLTQNENERINITDMIQHPYIQNAIQQQHLLTNQQINEIFTNSNECQQQNTRMITKQLSQQYSLNTKDLNVILKLNNILNLNSDQQNANLYEQSSYDGSIKKIETQSFDTNSEYSAENAFNYNQSKSAQKSPARYKLSPIKMANASFQYQEKKPQIKNKNKLKIQKNQSDQ